MNNEKIKFSFVYAAALTVIVRQLKAASYRILALHTQYDVSLTAERLMQFYRYWLDLTINHYATGTSSVSQGLLRELTREDMTQYALRGRRVKSFRRSVFTLTCPAITNAQNFIGVSVQELGHLLLNVCRDFDKALLSKLHHLPVKCRRINKAKQEQFELNLLLLLHNSFRRLWLAINSELKQLGIQNPPLFFLEHFGKLLGWGIGALADLLGKPTRQVLKNCQRPILIADDPGLANQRTRRVMTA